MRTWLVLCGYDHRVRTAPVMIHHMPHIHSVHCLIAVLAVQERPNCIGGVQQGLYYIAVLIVRGWTYTVAAAA